MFVPKDVKSVYLREIDVVVVKVPAGTPSYVANQGNIYAKGSTITFGDSERYDYHVYFPETGSYSTLNDFAEITHK